MGRPFSVAVYCSSSDDIDRQYFEAADRMGAGLAARGWRLVFGAGSVGLMGEVARATHRGGGQIYGVIPHALDQREVTYEACEELVRVDTMRQRKALMDENSDAFVALPGGFGTLEEIIEVIVLRQLRYHERPLVFVNTLGYWDPLIVLFEQMIAQGFSHPVNRDLYKVVESPEEALDYIASFDQSQAEPSLLEGEERLDEQTRTVLE